LPVPEIEEKFVKMTKHWQEIKKDNGMIHIEFASF
jgi:hypothetical protein